MFKHFLLVLFLCSRFFSPAQNILESGLGSLSLAGCSLTGGEIRMAGAGSYFSRKAYINCETTVEEIDMYCKMRADSFNASGVYQYAIGKMANTAGTMIVVSGNDSTTKIMIDKLSGTSATYIGQYVLPFKIDTGEVYTFRVGKRIRNLVIEIYNSDSTNYFYVDSLAYPTPFFGCLWGTPFIGAETGVVSILDFNLTTPYNLSPRLSIWGDSFIEGNSLTNQEDRYSFLLQDSIGQQECTIIGKGGESSSSISGRFRKESQWFRNSKYGLLALGTNDNLFSTWKSNILKYIDSLEAHGTVPILNTLPPRFDRLSYIAQVNNWIKTTYNGPYIDVAAPVSLPGAWLPGMYLPDSIHPSAAGHAAIYQQIQVDAPYLFRSDTPYTIDFFNETTNEAVNTFTAWSTLSSYSSYAVGASAVIPVSPGNLHYFKDTSLVAVPNRFEFVLWAPKRPAAPTTPVIDFAGGNYDWTYNPLFMNVSDYEYSLDSGTWVTCTSKPIYSPGATDLQLRIKATSSRFKSNILYFDTTTTSIAELASGNMQVFPNPFSDRVITKGLAEETEITIFASDGRAVRSSVVPAGNAEIDTESLPAGLYLVTLKSEHHREALKMVKR